MAHKIQVVLKEKENLLQVRHFADAPLRDTTVVVHEDVTVPAALAEALRKLLEEVLSLGRAEMDEKAADAASVHRAALLRKGKKKKEVTP